MSYEPTIWKKGDKVTSTKLNKIENGIQGNDEEVTSIKEGLSAMSTATSSDVGKALKAKTVTDGKVTEWEFGEAGVTVELDATLTDATKAAQAKAVGDKIGKIKTLDEYTQTSGTFKSDGTWVNATSPTNKHIVIPINPLDTVDITANSTRGASFAFVKTYTQPVNGANIDFSSETGFTKQLGINADATASYTAPSDVHYIIILSLASGVNALPSTFVVNGIDGSKSVYENLSEIVDVVGAIKADVLETAEEVEAMENPLNDLVVSVDYKKLSQYPIGYGLINGSLRWDYYNPSGNTVYRHIAVPVKAGNALKLVAPSTNGYQIVFLRSYEQPTSSVDADISQDTGFTNRITVVASGAYTCTVPSDVTYLYISLGTNANINPLPQELCIDSINLVDTLTANISNLLAKSSVSWAALGDSITYGYYSEIDGGGSVDSHTVGRETIAWAFRVASENGWNLTNLGSGGAGFLHVASGGGTGTEGYKQARNTDFTPYELVTVAYGINDWKSNSVMGTINDDATLATQTTVIGAMKATIEAIATSNPKCKIIVITPLNCRGYNYDFGDESTNYGIGYEFSNSGTLDSFTIKLIEVCNYYGIQYIDMTHYSCLNRKNLPTLLPDGVHPSVECHALLARELARKITFS